MSQGVGAKEAAEREAFRDALDAAQLELRAASVHAGMPLADAELMSVYEPLWEVEGEEILGGGGDGGVPVATPRSIPVIDKGAGDGEDGEEGGNYGKDDFEADDDEDGTATQDDAPGATDAAAAAAVTEKKVVEEALGGEEGVLSDVEKQIMADSEGWDVIKPEKEVKGSRGASNLAPVKWTPSFQDTGLRELVLASRAASRADDLLAKARLSGPPAARAMAWSQWIKSRISQLGRSEVDAFRSRLKEGIANAGKLLENERFREAEQVLEGLSESASPSPSDGIVFSIFPPFSSKHREWVADVKRLYLQAFSLKERAAGARLAVIDASLSAAASLADDADRMVGAGDFRKAIEAVETALTPLDMEEEGLKVVVERLEAIMARAKQGQSEWDTLQRRASGEVDGGVGGGGGGIQVLVDQDDGMLFMLCAEGRQQELTSLLRKRASLPGGMDVGMSDPDGMTLLMHACKGQHDDCISTLMDAGARATGGDALGLYIGEGVGGTRRGVRLLLRGGAARGVRVEGKGGLLHVCAAQGRVDLLEELLFCAGTGPGHGPSSMGEKEGGDASQGDVGGESGVQDVLALLAER